MDSNPDGSMTGMKYEVQIQGSITCDDMVKGLLSCLCSEREHRTDEKKEVMPSCKNGKLG